jgi:hypothetical protein
MFELLRLWGLLERDWMHFTLWDDSHEPLKGTKVMVWMKYSPQGHLLDIWSSAIGICRQRVVGTLGGGASQRK